MSDLAAKLGRFRLLDVARGAANGPIEVLRYAGPERSEFIRRAVATGWAAANVQRLLGAPVERPLAQVSLITDDAVSVPTVLYISPPDPEVDARRGACEQAVPSRPIREPAAARVRRRPAPRPSSIPPPPPSSVRTSPTERVAQRTPYEQLPRHERPRLLAGRGERLDCAHESECLGRLLQSLGTRRQSELQAAHCPTGCAWLEAPSREQRLAEATAGKAQGYHA